MDASLALSLLYFALKGAAYVGWCRLGARWFRPAALRPGPLALGLGLLRLALGLVFGVAIFLGSAALVATLGELGLGTEGSEAVAYAAVYVPVRWVEWAIIEALLHGEARTFSGFILGPSSRSQSWRIGGTMVSCLADVPLMLSLGGLPIGRFMC